MRAMIYYSYESFEEADCSNIPVDIWLTTSEPNDTIYNENGDEVIIPKYKLKASNYIPRKACVGENVFVAYSDNLKELQQLLKDHVIPLYKDALNKLEYISNTNEVNDNTNLYYWDK